MGDSSQALVVAGHGSHRDPDSSASATAHAETIRDREIFAEVRTAFWKEEPSFREILRTLESDVVFVVPLFMSEGYFVDRILPRELRLTGETPLDVDKRVHLAEPVGTHEAMRDVILHRAQHVTGDPTIGPGIGLAVVGHGTERHDASDQSTRDHVDRLRAAGRFDDVQALFLDEPPSIGDAARRFETTDIVVVPLFVADGYHTRTDIPTALGLADDGHGGFDLPSEVDGRRIWYAGAVGTDDRMADVILERAAEAGASIDRPNATGPTTTDEHLAALLIAAGDGVDFDGLTVRREGDAYVWSTSVGGADRLFSTAIEERAIADAEFVSNWYYWTQVVGDPDSARYAYLRWLEHADDWAVPERYDRLAVGIDRSWGELRITTRVRVDGVRRYEARHLDDHDCSIDDLEPLWEPGDAWNLGRFDVDGRYRPLRSAPTLRDGWVFPDVSGNDLVRIVDTFYPASIANWRLERAGELDVEHWRAVADRQTGMYDVVDELPPAALEWATAACCTDDVCLKRRRWDLDEDQPLDVPRGEGNIPCREACSLFIAAAREWALLEQEDPRTDEFGLMASETTGLEALVDGPIDEIREGAVADPAARYRVRYLRAKRCNVQRDGEDVVRPEDDHSSDRA